MDVYQKVLKKIHEITGGRDSVDVDLTDLLKKEGFYSNIDNIRDYMSSESWITETSRKNVVRLTHWGVAAAKRSTGPANEAGSTLSKEAARIAVMAKQFAVLADEFAGDPTKKRLGALENAAEELASAARSIRSSMS